MHKDRSVFPVPANKQYFYHHACPCICNIRKEKTHWCRNLSHALPWYLGSKPSPIQWEGMSPPTSGQTRFFLLGDLSRSSQNKISRFVLPCTSELIAHTNKCVCYTNPSSVWLYVHTWFNVRKHTTQQTTDPFAFKFAAINSYTNNSALCKGGPWLMKPIQLGSQENFKLPLVLHPVPHNTSNSSHCRPYFALQ